MWSIWLALWVWGAELGAQAQSGPQTTEAERRKQRREAAAQKRRGPGGNATARSKAKAGSKAKSRGKAKKRGSAGPAAASPLAAKKARLNALSRRRRFRSVVSQAGDALSRFPDDPDLHAFRAVGSAEFGAYVDASIHLMMSQGAELLPILSLAAEADVRRYMGDSTGAIEARRVLIAIDASPQRELVMLTRIFEDHQINGDLAGMWSVVYEAMAQNPESAVPHSLMALASVAEGDVEGAEAALWMAERFEPKSIVYATARVEVYLAMGMADHAAALADERRALVLRSKTFAAARGRALLAAGRADDALELCDVAAWRLGEELWHPELLAVEARTYAALGWTDAALAVADRLSQTYPAAPTVQEAIAEVVQAVSAP